MGILSRSSYSRFAAALFAAAVALPFGCGLSSEGAPPNDDGKPCNIDAQCSGDDPCTIGVCEANQLCKVTKRPDGYKLPDPKSGDCHAPVCKGGKTTVVVADDDTEDDGNPCTLDRCKDGKPVHEEQGSGACSLHGNDGTCDAGTCVVTCSTGADCKVESTCVVAACDASTNQCLFQLLDGIPTPGVTQSVGDCRVRVCANGVDKNEVDNSDLPTTTNTCLDATCTAGAPSTPPRAKDTHCSSGGGTVCDGSGHCVACNEDSQCPGDPTACVVPSCKNNVCQMANAPANKLIPPQSTGDCLDHVCDGNGNETNVPDDADLPAGSDCTTPKCNNGVASTPPKGAGISCGTGGATFCDGMGNCTGCTLNSECTPPATCGGGGTSGACGCTAATCKSLNKTCGSHPDGCGGTVVCDDSKQDGDESDVDCGGTTCNVNCSLGQKCNSGTDCMSGTCADGVCCNMACSGCNACTALKKGSGSDGICGAIVSGKDPHNFCTDQQATCGTTDFCDGTGVCNTYPTGATCVSAVCNSATNLTKAETCSSTGKCTSNGTQSCFPFLCSNGGCTGSCAGDTDCAAKAYCVAPLCTPRKMNGLGCTANDQCFNGNCSPDGVRCDTPCTGTCMSCKLAATLGTCSPIMNGPDNAPSGTCSGTSTCDANGNCNAVDGQGCNEAKGGADCASGFCTDSVCCESACDVCQQCNATPGTCTDISQGSTDSDPPGTCTGANACDGTSGASACKLANGGDCTAGGAAVCASGFCPNDDNVCCDKACTGSCHECSTGSCLPIAQFTNDPNGGCGGPTTCDGAGNCLAAPGQPCSVNSDCASNSCTASVCD